MYADYEFYRAEYGGRKVSVEDWPHFSRLADGYLDRITLRRLRAGYPVTEEVQLAACALAEAYAAQEEAKQGHATGIRSENVDGYSVTYESEEEAKARRGAALAEAAALFLPLSHPLRYAGV